MYYTLEPLTTDESESSNPDTIVFKPSVKKKGGEYQAIVTIANSDGRDIVLGLAHETNLKTYDEAMQFANYFAKVMAHDMQSGYERYQETGEEP